jgi:hypothetical protein
LHDVASVNLDPHRSPNWGMTLFGMLACLAGGCATWGSGPYGVPVDAANRPRATAAPPPLLVSASEAASYSTAYLGLVEVTFENHTPVWKQVDRVTLDFGSPAQNKSVTIPSGDDIDAWARAITIRTSLQGISPVTAIEALGFRPVNRLGAWMDQHSRPAAARDAAGVLTNVDSQASAAPTPPSYPDQHLLTTPFRIPPGLFTKRWILLSTSDNPPAGCIDSMVLSYETSDHATGRVLLSFKVRGTDWQGPACPIQGVTPNRAM